MTTKPKPAPKPAPKPGKPVKGRAFSYVAH